MTPSSTAMDSFVLCSESMISYSYYFSIASVLQMFYFMFMFHIRIRIYMEVHILKINA